jgi:hypothetical protein
MTDAGARAVLRPRSVGDVVLCQVEQTRSNGARDPTGNARRCRDPGSGPPADRAPHEPLGDLGAPTDRNDCGR